MNFLGSKKTELAFGEGERFPLTKQMTVAVKRHMVALKDADLSAYTFERRRSDYKDARSDLVIYDATSAKVLSGREFNSGPTSIWDH
jgi:hypothetical protein